MGDEATNLAWWLGALSLLAVLLVDSLWLIVRRARRSPAAVDEPHRRQLWLQDLILVSLVYGGALFFALKRFGLAPWLVSGFYVLPAVGSGVLAALSLCQRAATLHENGLVRAAVFILVTGLFGIGPDVSLVVWWLGERVAYWRRQSSAGLTAYAQWCIGAVLLVYGIAFFLPLQTGPTADMHGYNAYRICLEGSSRALAGLELHGDEVLLALPWSANPALWVGISFLIAGRWLAAVSAAAVALLFGLSIKLAALYTVFESSGINLHAEIQEAANSPAYYTWLGSMAVLLAAGLWGLAKAGRRRAF